MDGFKKFDCEVMVKYLDNFPKIHININNNFKKSTAKKWPKRNCPPADALWGGGVVDWAPFPSLKALLP